MPTRIVLLGVLVIGAAFGLQADAAAAEPVDRTLPLSSGLTQSAPEFTPPTDDSMWVYMDSVSIGSPPSSFWRGLCLDPNGQHVWVAGGDGTPIIQKRDRFSGALVYTFNGQGSGPYDLVRFGDSLCVACYGSNAFFVYDTLGTYARTFSFSPGGLRGVDWDGTNFWASSVTGYRIYVLSRVGALLKTLNPSPGPSWMGCITLDKTFSNRIWITNGNASTNNIFYCSFDTVAGTYSSLATFNYACSGYPGGLAFQGPLSGGSFVWAIARSGTYLMRVKVHEPQITHDVGCTRVLAPTGSVDSGAAVAPACSVYNYGTQTETYKVRLRIGSYVDSATVSGHAPATRQYVTFPNWTASPRGTFGVSCSTELTGDAVGSNNKATGSVTVTVKDVGAVSLAVPLPGDTYPQDTVITPKASWRNYGTAAASFEAWMILADPADGRVYSRMVPVTGLAPGGSLEIGAFPACTLKTAGAWTARCSSYLVGDLKLSNDTIDRGFVVKSNAPPPTPGWTAKTPMPAGAKAIKDGGWLAYDEGTRRIYASRGNKQPDFFAYDPAGDSWGTRSPWLPGVEAKLPGKGSAGCADGNGVIYATKGNNKSGFWKYDAAANAWTQKKDVPLGLSNKKVKGGTDITWAYKGSTGSPYLLKGYKNEFYRYDVPGDSWQTLTPAPVGASQKWDKGSWLAYDDSSRKVYAFKAKYMELYSYSTETDSWSAALAPMPMSGSAGSKKAKDGSAGACVWLTPPRPRPWWIYALKGGNTREFWQYDIATNSWAEKETIPTGAFKKKVKAGADMVCVDGVMYATKGNKSNELWMYTPGVGSFAPHVLPSTQDVGMLRDASGVMRISPNPLAGGFATLSFTRPLDHWSTGPLRLSIYNASGSLVHSTFGLSTSSFRLDLRSMPAGVYLIRLESDSLAATHKLVVQR